MTRYTVHFSHEFGEGPSGPARSYWTIRDAGHVNIGTVCLHHRDAINAELQMNNIAQLLDDAFQAGEKEMQRKFQRAIGL